MAIDHENKTKYTRGLKKLDVALGRPDKQELIVIYAGAGVGKTEFTHFVARANADAGVKVLYLSLEMPAEQLAERYAIKRAGIKTRIEYQDKQYTKHQGELIDKYYQYFMNYNNITLIGQEKEYDLNSMLSEDPQNMGVLNEYYEKGYKIFIIDNLGKVSSTQEEWKAQKEITSKLQDWKNKTKAIVILIHHTKGKDGIMRGTDKIKDNCTRMIKLERDNDPDGGPLEKAQLILTQEKDSTRGEYVQTECYFSTGEYVEEFETPSVKRQKQIEDTLDDERF